MTELAGWPQSLPEPIMVGKNSLDHGEEGDAHRGDDEDLEGDSKAVEVVLPDQPLEAQEKDTLDDQLAKCLANSLWKEIP